MTEHKLTLGFIGLGVMGRAICRNIASKHAHPVHAFDLNAEALDAAVRAGAIRAGSVREVAEAADIIFLSLPGGEQVHEVCCGETGISSAGRTGKLIVDLSTTSVAEARSIAKKLGKSGIGFADAPVARTRQAAEAGTLSVMVGASEEIFVQIEPLLRYLASDVTHCGDVGCGQVVKLVNNTLLFENVAALGEMMVVAERAGVEPQRLLEAVSLGSGDSFALRNHGMKSMAPREFPVKAFPCPYVLKDLGYAIELAKEVGVEPRLPTLAATYFRAAIEQGLGDSYFPVIIEVVDRESRQ